MRYFISQGPATYADEFAGLAARHYTTLWTVNRNVTLGDKVVFYLGRPRSAFYGLGTVVRNRLEDGEPHGWPGYMMTKVRIDRALDPPVTLTDVRKKIRGWAWLKMPLAHAEVPATVLAKFLAVLNERAAAEPRSVADVVREARRGGGFGTPDINKRVEQAAMRFVRAHFERDGWKVDDHSRQNLGYDLFATRRKHKLRLEVKGTQGTEPGFILTANELRLAEHDASFRLCVVCRALDPTKSIEIFTAREMRSRFQLQPLAYVAREKPGRRATR